MKQFESPWCVQCMCLSHSRWSVPERNTVRESQAKYQLNIIVCVCVCVSTDCGAERSCPQSGASSPSHSTSSHTLSSAKSKGSLRRQSKPAVCSLTENVLAHFHLFLCISLLVSPCFCHSTRFDITQLN